MDDNSRVNMLSDLLLDLKIFNNSKDSTIAELVSVAEILDIRLGQTVLRSNTIETHVFLVLEGSLRLLGYDPTKNDLYTLGHARRGEFIGVVNLLRQSPCEAAISRERSKLVSFPVEKIIELMRKDIGFADDLQKIQSDCEGAEILNKVLEGMNPPPQDTQEWVKRQLKSSKSRVQGDKATIKLLSTSLEGEEGYVGQQISADEVKRLKLKSNIQIRYWYWKPSEENTSDVSSSDPIESTQLLIKKSEDKKAGLDATSKDLNGWQPSKALNLKDIGLKIAASSTDLQGFKPIKGNGPVGTHVAILRMIARAYKTPCPIDILEKTIEGAIERAGSVPIQGMGQLVETMGLQTQVGRVKLSQVHRLEFPVLVEKDTKYVLITGYEKETLTLADPESGWVHHNLSEAREIWGEDIKVLLLKRLSDTPEKTFGWGWFAPVLKRFKWQLSQVLLASLFIQLFQLANPLLIQQIIDKVISQSNLSALQVLGAALVISALFQGLLTAVRTWLLIDTTDRMDLLLGSQVIDRLLRLPLRFFEKRPVGELSQRLSELGNLRSFLTGTAITTTLDLLFASIYIVIMLAYSPLLAVVALGTIPLYVIIIIFIAPLYRRLIRKQAQYAAKTQSHLIETLGGIQTVKAQHFELNSRWRWQERYSGQIAEGFKSVVLGSSIGEVGNFLNQLSSLLIIWVGVYQVVNGDLSLGQMIAFRIIAGYVTGPILRLSSLWQGFQQVEISMERLADIVDQVPEAGLQDSEKISLPPIRGNVSIENLDFRFGKHGPNQIKGVDLEICEGNFIGIVGQSGSGKSTLMKLLPRLYEPNQGRILIDGYDISKVSLSSVRQQIGIVPQDCLLFEGTIRDNIIMNNPDASTESVIRVAKAAEAHDFIMELPDGYATRIGERGSGLSGGQRQRIAIARTLLQNPKLLILDEATSALDYDTEANVCFNLQKELSGKTVFFITHRLSTVKNADKIIVMHEGKIEEQGTHQELMKLEGRYSTLYAHQGDA